MADPEATIGAPEPLARAPEARRGAGPWAALAGVNVAATGILFGLMQWGVFFVLQSYLASTAILYLLATSAWLAGSVAGLAIPAVRARPRSFVAVLGEPLWLAAALGAYFGVRRLAVEHAYDLRFLPPFLLLVAVMGAYAGRFFRYRARVFRRPKWLLVIENTGFVVGMVLCVVSLFAWGPDVLVVLPAVTGAVALATAVGLAFHPGTEES